MVSFSKPVNFAAHSIARFMYQHLFFDLDHTLWDFETNSRLSLEALYDQFELKKWGIDDFERFLAQYTIHNDKLWERYRNGFIKQDELRWKRVWHTLLDFKLADEQLARAISIAYLDLLPTRTAVFPHTFEALDYLRSKGYKMHLITNGFEEVQHSKLRHSKLAPYFTHVITSEGSNTLKPKKEIFDFALAKAGAQKEESIMLGDNMEVDIEGASNAGLDQVFVNHKKETPSFRPTYTIHSLKELESIF
jgi:putative hydrolase of the HAD superfamily